MLKIIGIDPGLAGTGIGIVYGRGLKIAGFSYGAINTSKDFSLSNRLNQIFTKIQHVLETEKPDLMIIEDVFLLEKYPKAAISLGKVCGVIMLAAEQTGISILEVPVREAKQVLTGNGNASKEQLEKSVRHTLQLQNPIRPFHSSDALGLALIGLFRYGKESMRNNNIAELKQL